MIHINIPEVSMLKQFMRYARDTVTTINEIYRINKERAVLH